MTGDSCHVCDKSSPTEKEWEAQAPVLVNLIHHDGHSLKNVRGIMHSQHNFHATEEAYARRFKKNETHRNNLKRKRHTSHNSQTDFPQPLQNPSTEIQQESTTQPTDRPQPSTASNCKWCKATYPIYAQWEIQKPVINDLLDAKGYSLEEVREYMHSKHKFHATLDAYRIHFEQDFSLQPDNRQPVEPKQSDSEKPPHSKVKQEHRNSWDTQVDRPLAEARQSNAEERTPTNAIPIHRPCPSIHQPVASRAPSARIPYSASNPPMQCQPNVSSTAYNLPPSSADHTWANNISRPVQFRELLGEFRCGNCIGKNCHCYLHPYYPVHCLACRNSHECFFRRTITRNSSASFFLMGELFNQQER